MLALGHRPWPADAFGDQLCDGPQWAPYNEHAHRFSSGNLGNISIDDIGDTGWYWGPLKEEKYSALRKVLNGKVLIDGRLQKPI